MGTEINSEETVFKPGPVKTGKTDKTDCNSNRNFLQTVFGGDRDLGAI
jgi:hypothetical protein